MSNFKDSNVIAIVLKNLPDDSEEYENIIQSKKTISRLQELNNGLKAVIAETRFRPEIIVKSDAQLSNHKIMALSLMHINMRVLNTKLLDIQEFVKNKRSWSDEVYNPADEKHANLVKNDEILHGNIRKLFSSFLIWNGMSVIERAKNTLEVITVL